MGRFYEPSLQVTDKLHQFLMHYLHNVMHSQPAQNRRFFLERGTAIAVAVCTTSMTALAITPPKLRVAAASDLKFVLSELCQTFTKMTGQTVDLQFGSSGNLTRQITQGLPLDLFLSADEALVLSLFDDGFAPDKGALYATGRIAWLMPKNSRLQLPKDEAEARLTLAKQLQSVRKFAIANPEHAPYGRAAKEALQNLGLWEQLQPKLVLGDNISQATQFVTSGAAQAGITALSLVLAPEVGTPSDSYWLMPASFHTPLKQRMVVLKSAHPTAKALFDYLQTPAAKTVLAKYGFSV
jgi:molybdate transport system substrate-binding protein